MVAELPLSGLTSQALEVVSVVLVTLRSGMQLDLARIV